MQWQMEGEEGEEGNVTKSVCNINVTFQGQYPLKIASTWQLQTQSTQHFVNLNKAIFWKSEGDKHCFVLSQSKLCFA